MKERKRERGERKRERGERKREKERREREREKERERITDTRFGSENRTKKEELASDGYQTHGCSPVSCLAFTAQLTVVSPTHAKTMAHVRQSLMARTSANAQSFTAVTSVRPGLTRARSFRAARTAPADECKTDDCVLADVDTRAMPVWSVQV